MKEIKFRAWDKVNKKFIDDTDIATNQAGLLFIRSEGQVDFSPISLTKSTNYEIQFFTGLQDKNGKEIYEGDIIEMEDPKFESGIYNYEISFSEATFFADEITRDDEKPCFPLGQCPVEQCKVIGNIYENKDLLK